jgi:hypothetical protein
MDGYLHSKNVWKYWAVIFMGNLQIVFFLNNCFLRCLKCFAATDELVDKKKAMDLNAQTLNRLAILRRPDVDGSTIDVEEIW